MSALSATILSDVTIASTKASLAALDGLQQTILSAAEANPATIGSDEGVGSLYGFVRNARAKFADPGTADAKQQMPAPILVRPDIGQRVGGQWQEANARIALFDQPGEELGALGNLQAETASVGWLGITVTGALDAG